MITGSVGERTWTPMTSVTFRAVFSAWVDEQVRNIDRISAIIGLGR
jgi:hypothetical protein